MTPGGQPLSQQPDLQALRAQRCGPVAGTQAPREASMTDPSIRDGANATANRDSERGPQQDARSSARSFWHSPAQWLAACHAARAGQNAYDDARVRGASRERAANDAFEALTGARRSTAQPKDTRVAFGARCIDGSRDPPKPAGSGTPELDRALAAAATPRDASTARGDIRVAVLCLLLFAGLAAFGFLASMGVPLNSGTENMAARP